MIIGEGITLREIEEDDLNLIVEWRNNPEVLRWLFSYLPLSKTKQRMWYERYVEDTTQQTFIIEVKKDKTPIGTVELKDIDYKNQKSEVGILIDRRVQRSGYGYESLNLLLDYAFKELNLRKIIARVFQENLLAINLFEKIGFKKEGILEKQVFKAGAYRNIVIMAKFR